MIFQVMAESRTGESIFSTMPRLGVKGDGRRGGADAYWLCSARGEKKISKPMNG